MYEYHLTDNHTGKVLKVYPEGKRAIAQRRADNLDLQYGAIRYSVRLVKVV